MTATTNYGLCQWGSGEPLLRAQLNGALAQVDTGLAQAQQTADSKCAIVIGTYVGNGEADRTLSLGFRPAAMVVEEESGERSLPYLNGGVILSQRGMTNSYGATATLTNDGLTLHGVYGNPDFLALNRMGHTFHYIAFR